LLVPLEDLGWGKHTHRVGRGKEFRLDYPEKLLRVSWPNDQASDSDRAGFDRKKSILRRPLSLGARKMNVRLVHNSDAQSTLQSRGEGDKARMIRTLRGLLSETCRLRNEGVAYAKLSHAQGYADGYMKVLTDAGYVTQRELLDIVVDVRRGVDGPATRTLSVSQEALLA